MLGLGLKLGVGRGRGGGTSNPITSSVNPTLGALTDGDTPNDAFTSGTYSSTAGTISSEVAAASINGGAYATGNMSTTLSGGDTVRVRETVTDSVANTRAYFTTQQTVAGGGIGSMVIGSTFQVAA